MSKTFVAVTQVFLAVALLVAASFSQTGGALGNGTSARSTALGGATVASVDGPLEAMQSNPAGLASLHGRSADLSVTSLFVTGSFANSVTNNGTIGSAGGTLPYGAFAMRLNSRLVLGLSSAPDTLMKADWSYLDPPGTGGASYGVQQNRSTIVALRSAAGLGFTVNKKLSFGASLGAVYNANSLHAPYIFQSNPDLAGLKTLLDLHTSGVGWNGSFGAEINPTSKMKIGLAYRSKTTVHSHGNAAGNADAQFNALGIPFQPDFKYSAEVDTSFPQSVSGGVSWETWRHARLHLQGEWINWESAFRQLPVHLSNGTNADINSFLGSTSLSDTVPLNWDNQGVVSAGLEMPLTESFALRGGYSYATNPVPASTLTPMTAAILQHSLATGFGYSHGRCRYDLTYQAQLPASQSVGQSGLLAGEYDNTRVHVTVQSLTFTTRIRF
ncbi:MAG TPA: outer membrane protein transport protein [Terriglobales bacterium]|nr:outer membrane protein transport protein [Terriglobales bacterium]